MGDTAEYIVNIAVTAAMDMSHIFIIVDDSVTIVVSLVVYWDTGLADTMLLIFCSPEVDLTEIQLAPGR